MKRWLVEFDAICAEDTPVPIAPLAPKAPEPPKKEAQDGPIGTNGTNGTAPDDPGERAAIIEHDARIPREWAAGFAKLCAMPCPAGITAQEWLGMVDACGRLLDRWGAQLSDLGWTTADLFGLDAQAPMARLDHAGLLRFLIGREVVSVSEDVVELMTRNGGTQSVRRGRGGPGQVAVWELAS